MSRSRWFDLHEMGEEDVTPLPLPDTLFAPVAEPSNPEPQAVPSPAPRKPSPIGENISRLKRRAHR